VNATFVSSSAARNAGIPSGCCALVVNAGARCRRRPRRKPRSSLGSRPGRRATILLGSPAKTVTPTGPSNTATAYGSIPSDGIVIRCGPRRSSNPGVVCDVGTSVPIDRETGRQAEARPSRAGRRDGPLRTRRAGIRRDRSLRVVCAGCNGSKVSATVDRSSSGHGDPGRPIELAALPRPRRNHRSPRSRSRRSAPPPGACEPSRPDRRGGSGLRGAVGDVHVAGGVVRDAGRASRTFRSDRRRSRLRPSRSRCSPSRRCGVVPATPRAPSPIVATAASNSDPARAKATAPHRPDSAAPEDRPPA